MKAIARALLCLCSSLYAALTAAQGPLPDIVFPKGTASQYFGQIATPCRAREGKSADDRCNEFIAVLENLGQSCVEADARCDAGKKVLEALFPDTYRPVLVDYILFFDQRKTLEGKTTGGGAFRLHPPRLMFDNRNTPHLYGVRDIYILVFSQRKTCVEATVTTEFKTEPNPFTAIFKAIGGGVEAKEPKERQARATVEFHWHPLSGDPTSSGLWLGFGRGSVEENSSGRVSVLLRQPKSAGGPATERTTMEKKTVHRKTVDKDGNTTTETTTSDSVTTEKPKPPAEDDCSASDDPRYKANFVAANAFFSNSPATRAGFSLALGMTMNTRGTALSPAGSDETFNGYALAKYYFRRPELRADARHTGYRRSWSAFLGTSIKDAFDEIVTGVSWGHLFGSNVGALAGVNYIKAAEGSNEGRKWRVFAGLEYSF